MTYRDDITAKRERAERIAAELRAVRRRMDEINALSDKERELDESLTAASKDAGRARAKVSLPLLKNLKVASPCHERWEDMDGDARVRHCGRCEKNVYDLSAMTADAAESLLAQHGQNLCVRFYRRPDGTVMTADCPVGARRKRVRNVVVGAGAMAFTAVAGVMGYSATCTMGDAMVQGGVEPYYPDQGIEIMGEAVPMDYHETETETGTDTETGTETETETETDPKTETLVTSL